MLDGESVAGVRYGTNSLQEMKINLDLILAFLHSRGVNLPIQPRYSLVYSFISSLFQYLSQTHTLSLPLSLFIYR